MADLTAANNRTAYATRPSKNLVIDPTSTPTLIPMPSPSSVFFIDEASSESNKNNSAGLSPKEKVYSAPREIANKVHGEEASRRGVLGGNSSVPLPHDKAIYLSRFEEWDERRPSWQYLNQASTDTSTPYKGKEGKATAKVLFTSDLHIDAPKNRQWLEDLPYCPDETLIVAGDICTSLKKLRATFELLVARFQYVFYTPGNHELWTYAGQGNSIDKFFEILDIADECGVHVRPAWVSPGVAVVPLFSWYNSSLFGSSAAVELRSSQEQNFDRMCSWPVEIVGSQSDPHDSLNPGIASFFLDCNMVRMQRNDWPAASELESATVLTFSHFIPRPELFKGLPSLRKVMGDTELDVQLRMIGSCTHVFGHSHMAVDEICEEVRYVQGALGHPRDLGGCRGLPNSIWNCPKQPDVV